MHAPDEFTNVEAETQSAKLIGVAWVPDIAEERTIGRRPPCHTKSGGMRGSPFYEKEGSILFLIPVQVTRHTRGLPGSNTRVPRGLRAEVIGMLVVERGEETTTEI